jgi:hypothetical protein
VTWVSILFLVALAWAYSAKRLKEKLAETRASTADDGTLPTWSAGQGQMSFDVYVVGESFYMEHLEKIFPTPSGPRELRTPAVLIPSGTKHDANAVRVEVKGLQVGHLSRDDAVVYRRLLAKKFGANKTACAQSLIGGGGPGEDGKTRPIGVRLCIPGMSS